MRRYLSLSTRSNVLLAALAIALLASACGEPAAEAPDEASAPGAANEPPISVEDAPHGPLNLDPENASKIDKGNDLKPSIAYATNVFGTGWNGLVGQNFTPNGSVRIAIYDQAWVPAYDTTVTATADWGGAGGTIWLQNYPSPRDLCRGGANYPFFVYAFDYVKGWSNPIADYCIDYH